MSGENSQEAQELEINQSSELAHYVGAVAWGMFFIWVGTAFLMDVGHGIGLLGIGIITLGAQAARRHFNLKLEGFWVVVGFIFLGCGLWALFEARIPLVPIALIVAGLVVLFSAGRGKPRMRT